MDTGRQMDNGVDAAERLRPVGVRPHITGHERIRHRSDAGTADGCADLVPVAFENRDQGGTDKAVRPGDEDAHHVLRTGRGSQTRRPRTTMIPGGSASQPMLTEAAASATNAALAAITLSTTSEWLCPAWIARW